MINFIHPLLAQTTWHAQNIAQALLYSAIFGVLGIVLVFVGFKIFDKAIAKVDLEQEVCKGNVAAAILSGAAIIAIAIIVAAAMS